MQISELPHVDEHAIDIAADADDVWPVLVETLDRTCSRPGMARYTHLVGCADHTPSGPRPLAEGSTVPGFRVTTARPPSAPMLERPPSAPALEGATSELVLEGRHRFSTYALIFRLDQIAAGRSRLSAESRAVFPGVAGRIYRLLVIGTGGHVLVVRRLIADIKRRSEP